MLFVNIPSIILRTDKYNTIKTVDVRPDGTGSMALLLNGQVVESWTLGNPKQEKFNRVGARKTQYFDLSPLQGVGVSKIFVACRCFL